MYVKPPTTTREASDYQEKRILRLLPTSFRQSSNSGAGKIRKGDLFNNDWIIEAKTHMKPVSNHHVLYGDLKELRKHGLSAGKQTAYVFDFGFGTEVLYELTRVEECVPVVCPEKLSFCKRVTYGLSFNAKKTITAFPKGNRREPEHFIKIHGSVYRIKLFDPKNYM